MNLLDRHMKFCTIVLFAVLLPMQLSGPIYVSGLTAAAGTSHTESVCTHEEPASGHESGDGHAHFTQCHILDAPCDTTPTLALDTPPVVSTLIIPDSGVLLTGYGVPLDIPPELCS